MLEIIRTTTTTSIKLGESTGRQYLSTGFLDIPVNEFTLSAKPLADERVDETPNAVSEQPTDAANTDDGLALILRAAMEKFAMQNSNISPQKIVKVLVFSANPRDTGWLQIDEEVSSIDKALHVSKYRDNIDIRPHFAVKVSELQTLLLRHKPNIVHFSGHGSRSSQIILPDNQGKSRPVSPRALSNLFKLHSEHIRCVVLNACFSQEQANAIAQYIDCVVGMSKSITDSAAISFSAAFYQSIGYGESIEFAFNSGLVEIEIEDLDEQDTPKLIALRCNPKELKFF
jgi:hypothetical protein